MDGQTDCVDNRTDCGHFVMHPPLDSVYKNDDNTKTTYSSLNSSTRVAGVNASNNLITCCSYMTLMLIIYTVFRKTPPLFSCVTTGTKK